MRVLDVIASVNPTGGGPVESLKQHAAAGRSRGVSIDVASLDDPAAPWVKDFPGRLHALGPARSPYFYSARLVPWLRSRARDYEAVIIHGLWQYHAFGAWRALRESGVPYYVFPHGMLDPWFKRAFPLKHLKKWLYWPWADYRVLRDAKAVLFTCEVERVLARQSFWLYRCREEVVGYGTMGAKGDPELERERFLREFPELTSKRIVLFLSRLHQKKGCDLLIDAFARVAGRDGSLHLVMAGPDQVGWRAELAARARARGVADRVTWTGMLSGDLKWGAYRAAEVFVLPSHQENFGIVVAEAMACGLPVLISDKVNIYREIENAGAGIVAADDLRGTESLLEAWLDATDGDREAMSRNARECFRDNFELGAAFGKLYELLRAA